MRDERVDWPKFRVEARVIFFNGYAVASVHPGVIPTVEALFIEWLNKGIAEEIQNMQDEIIEKTTANITARERLEDLATDPDLWGLEPRVMMQEGDLYE